ncbi:MAG: NAD-dependent epimerase/dehydratase family protein [Thermodesulfobacteriota bacterium]
MSGKKRAVLITGVAHTWGSRLASLLEADPEFDALIGIDYMKPEKPFARMEFFQIEPHHPLLPELLKVTGVDTVCHLLFEDAYAPSEEVFDLNVMGTMDLLAACGAGETPRVVLMSDAKVYGAVAENPHFLTEDTDFLGSYRHPYVIHRMEVEKIADRFSRQNPLPKITMLRFANILGFGVDTPMARYLSPQMVPTVFGYDPMMQLTHVKDVTAALYHAVKNDVPGTFNIAGDGFLPLCQMLRLGKKVSLPFGAPFLRLGGKIFQKTPIPDSLPIEEAFLKFPCLGDTARMKNVLGFSPQFTTRETIEDFLENQRLAKYLPKRSRSQADPKAAEKLQDYLMAKRRAQDYLTELIESFNKESGHDQ